MPTYEYRCTKGHDFELFQRMSDEPVGVCPKCRAKAKRLLSGGAGFLFKGDGFYITDYRSADYKKAAKADGSASSSSDSAGSGSGSAEKSGGDTGSKKGSGDSGSKKKASGSGKSPSSGSGTSTSSSSD
jgi:putative FmdB family regulatory protein